MPAPGRQPGLSRGLQFLTPKAPSALLRFDGEWLRRKAVTGDRWWSCAGLCALAPGFGLPDFTKRPRFFHTAEDTEARPWAELELCNLPESLAPFLDRNGQLSLVGAAQAGKLTARTRAPSW